MRYLLVTLALAFPVQAVAHEVQPPPREESCSAMKWLNSEFAKRYPMINGLYYITLKELASQAGNECEAYQEQAIDWADKEAEMAAAIERAAKKADRMLLR